MACYRMEGGTVVETDNASMSWPEATFHDGRNWISRATGQQWEHQKLYRSRKGRFYIEHTSNFQGTHPSAEWVSPEEAARWLVLNEHELPEELKAVAEEVTE